MPEKYIEIMSAVFDLKFMIPIGMIFGYSLPVDVDMMRIATTVIGTILAGTAWVFLKPIMVNLRNKMWRKKKKKNK